MIYNFICENLDCNKDVILDIKMSEYNSYNKYKCPYCDNDTLKRKVSDYCCNNSWNCVGAFGKSNSH